MNKNYKKLLNEFTSHWKNYVFQSIFATITIFFILFFLTFIDAVVVASIGASVFIVFAMPKAITARARNIIGGHLTGLVCGSLFALIPRTLFLSNIIVYSLAVGFSIFIMVVIDTEHPPAAGTALGVAMVGFSVNISFALISSTIILSLIHHIFKDQLIDLV